MSIQNSSYSKKDKVPYNTEINQFFVGREAKFNREILKVLTLERDLTAYEITSKLKDSIQTKIYYSTIFRRIRNLKNNAYWWIIVTGEKPSKKTEKSMFDTYGLSINGAIGLLSLEPNEYQLNKLTENYPLYLPCWLVQKLISKGADKSLVFEYIYGGLSEGLKQGKLSLNVSYGPMLTGISQSLMIKGRAMQKNGTWNNSLLITEEDLKQLVIDTEPLIKIISGWHEAIDFLSDPILRKMIADLLTYKKTKE